MKKKDEIADPNSCLNRAFDDEFLFVLRQKDKAMASTIRFWIDERIRLGLDYPDSAKLIEARKLADILEDSKPAGAVHTGSGV